MLNPCLLTRISTMKRNGEARDRNAAATTGLCARMCGALLRLQSTAHLQVAPPSSKSSDSTRSIESLKCQPTQGQRWQFFSQSNTRNGSIQMCEPVCKRTDYCCRQTSHHSMTQAWVTCPNSQRSFSSPFSRGSRLCDDLSNTIRPTWLMRCQVDLQARFDAP
jgi:hypothetical protein